MQQIASTERLSGVVVRKCRELELLRGQLDFATTDPGLAALRSISRESTRETLLISTGQRRRRPVMLAISMIAAPTSGVRARPIIHSSASGAASDAVHRKPWPKVHPSPVRNSS